MVRWLKKYIGDDHGDTLIEVTFALGIMVTVLVSATVLSLDAFRLGVVARQRTQLVNVAIEQAEGLRSFRDNANSWATFQGAISGSSHGACRVQRLDTGKLDCFYMSPVGGNWTPVTGVISSSASMPVGSFVEVRDVTSATPHADRLCALTLEVHYGEPVAGSTRWQEGILTVELVNQKYSGGNYNGDCQP